MRIVPVVDLKGGIVVHARRGQRAAYAPLRSPLVDGHEPVAVARALCAALRPHALYVADLDAIAGAAAGPRDDSGGAVGGRRALGRRRAPRRRDRAAALARAGVARNVVGTESLAARAKLDDSSTPRAAWCSASTCATER